MTTGARPCVPVFDGVLCLRDSLLKVFILYLLCSSYEQRYMVSVKRDSSYRIVAGTVREISSGKQDKLCDNERI